MEEGTAKPNFLDPTAEEFIPSSSSSQFNLPRPHQVYPPYPYYAPPQQAAADDNAESRSVVLSMVPPHVTESSLAHAMSAFGGVRAVELSSLVTEGIVTVHFYDLRSAQIAVAEIREQHVRQQSLLGQQYNNYGAVLENWGPPPNLMMMMMMTNQQQRGLIDGRAVWAQFASRGFDAMNQGSLYVAVSDPPISADDLKQIFQAFGPVKEVREAPSRKQHKFVEFYDVRDAARALIDLQNKVIGGRRFYIEFSRPAGSSSYHHQYRSRRMGHQNPGLPPRLARSNSSQASSSSSGSRGEGIVTTRRTSDARISNIVRNSSDGNKKKKNKESSSSCSSSSNATSLSKHHQQLSRKGGNWRNHGKSDAKNTGGGSSSSSTSSSRFQIKDVMEESECGSGSKLICRDSRTTVMIKNIPNKYSQKLLLNMLDNHCIHCNEQIIGEGGEGDHEHDHDQDQPFSAYDFVYLPIDFNNKCNVGYGFVNLTSPEATVSLYKAFHMQPWEVFNSRKICQVTYARLQGLEALKEHFKNSKFPCDNDEYFPVVFDPPRDGKQLTEPVAIGGRTSDSHCIKIRDAIDELGGASSTTASTQAPSDHDECEDHGDDDEDSEGPDGGRDETDCGISDALDQLAASS